MEKKVSKPKKVVKVEAPVVEPVKAEVKKEWVNLTIDEIYALNTVDNQGEVQFARAIEKALKVKNG